MPTGSLLWLNRFVKIIYLWLLHRYGDVWRHLIGLCEVNERPEARGPYFGRKVLKSSVLDMMFEFKESYDNFMR